MRPWQVPVGELHDRYDELDTVIGRHLFYNPLHICYTLILMNDDVSYDEHVKARDEMFEYFDYLSESERYGYIINHHTLNRNSINNSGLRYLPAYFIPRLHNSRCTRDSFKGFIAKLFTSDRGGGDNVTILQKGCASLFLQLVLEGIFTYDEMMTLLDEMDNLNDPTKKYTPMSNLVVSRYLPPNLPIDVLEKQVTTTGEEVVYVSPKYWNTVVFTAVMREITTFVRTLQFHITSVQQVQCETKSLISLVGRLRLILATPCRVASVLLPCLASVSEKCMVDLLRWLVITESRYMLFRHLCCSGNVMDEHALVERCIITLDDTPLKMLSAVNKTPDIYSRIQYLVKMYTEDV